MSNPLSISGLKRTAYNPQKFASSLIESVPTSRNPDTYKPGDSNGPKAVKLSDMLALTAPGGLSGKADFTEQGDLEVSTGVKGDRSSVDTSFTSNGNRSATVQTEVGGQELSASYQKEDGKEVYNAGVKGENYEIDYTKAGGDEWTRLAIETARSTVEMEHGKKNQRGFTSIEGKRKVQGGDVGVAYTRHSGQDEYQLTRSWQSDRREVIVGVSHGTQTGNGVFAEVKWQT